jgi:hypothetical protein
VWGDLDHRHDNGHLPHAVATPSSLDASVTTPQSFNAVPRSVSGSLRRSALSRTAFSSREYPSPIRDDAEGGDAAGTASGAVAPQRHVDAPASLSREGSYSSRPHVSSPLPPPPIHVAASRLRSSSVGGSAMQSPAGDAVGGADGWQDMETPPVVVFQNHVVVVPALSAVLAVNGSLTPSTSECPAHVALTSQLNATLTSLRGISHIVRARSCRWSPFLAGPFIALLAVPLCLHAANRHPVGAAHEV